MITCLSLLFLFLSFMYCISRYSIINHIVFFIFGVCYYFILPLILGENFYFLNLPLMGAWNDVYISVSLSDKLFVLLYSFFMVIAYFFGSKVALIICKNKTFVPSKYVINKNKIGVASSILLITLSILITIIIWILLRENFLKGYLIGPPKLILIGKIATLNLLWLVILLFTINSTNKWIRYFPVIFLIANSLFLLSTGGRIYVLFCVICLIIFFYESKKLPKLIKVYLFIFTIILVLVGVVRGGSFDLGLFLFISLSEPVFTSFSLFSFLLHDSNFLNFNFPSNFLNAFLLIYPDFTNYKESVVYSLHDMEFKFVHPLGALSFFASLIGNFGIIGGILFIGIISFILEILKFSQNIFFRIFYMFSFSILPFMLFRDPFSISIKVMFFSGLVIPIMINLTSYFVKIFTVKSK